MSTEHPDLARVPQVFPRFELRAEEDPIATKEKGYAVFKDVEWVVLVKKGGGIETPHKISRLRQDNTLWPYVEAAYKAWKEGREAPIDGFPLDQWPAVTRAQVETLRGLKLRSVEDVAAMNDAIMSRYGMGAPALREKAQAFLKTAQERGVIAAETAGLRQQVADAKAENDILKADLAELRAMVESLTAPREKPPARQRRQEAEAA